MGRRPDGRQTRIGAWHQGSRARGCGLHTGIAGVPTWNNATVMPTNPEFRPRGRENFLRAGVDKRGFTRSLNSPCRDSMNRRREPISHHRLSPDQNETRHARL